jgi:hypothetical protein
VSKGEGLKGRRGTGSERLEEGREEERDWSWVGGERDEGEAEEPDEIEEKGKSGESKIEVYARVRTRVGQILRGHRREDGN